LDAPELFLANYKLIAEVARFVARRHLPNESDVEDFTSTVMIQLIDHDYAIIRKFQGRSTFRTFISAVVANKFKDYRNHELGKFRPPPEVKRLGRCAVDLYRLLHRDHRTLEEVIPILLVLYPKETPQTLKRLAQRLPLYTPRPTAVEEEKARHVPAPDPPDPVLAGELLEKSRSLSRVLSKAIRELAKVDRQMLTLHFQAGMTVAEIARTLRIEQKLLYPRMNTLKKGLRYAAERAGFGPEDIAELIGQEGLEFDFGLGGPSTTNEEISRDDSDDRDDDEP